MNAIIGLAELLEHDAQQTHKNAEYVRKIKASSQQLLEIINNILDMSKIESGKAVMNMAEFDIQEILKQLEAGFSTQAEAKGLTFAITAHELRNEWLCGDKGGVIQILGNLLSNAIKYTSDGGRVSLDVFELDQTSRNYAKLCFRVKDNGIGMSREYLSRIYESFSREENTQMDSVQGTGLGMTIVKNLVDMMGGTIEVESAPGEGSTFTVVVPLVPVQDAEEDFSLGTLEAARVLVVDDDAQVVEGTLLILDELGLRGDAATSGAQAGSRVAGAHDENDDFRFIIVDWIMPGMDGIETVRRIRAEAGDSTPIVLLTAYDWADIEDEARAAGVSAFVSKPLFKSRLHRVLKEFADLEGAGDIEQPRAEGHVVGRVLLVEDNLLNREIASELIRTIGAEVEQAHDGQKAVEAAAAAPEGYFDLVFMDMQMPLMDGIEAPRAIRDRERAAGRNRVPIVAMTANAFTEDREQALEAGMDGFMTKPIDLGKLRRVLEEYLPENAE